MRKTTGIILIFIVILGAGVVGYKFLLPTLSDKFQRETSDAPEVSAQRRPLTCLQNTGAASIRASVGPVDVLHCAMTSLNREKRHGRLARMDEPRNGCTLP